jgi:protein-tyrosine kinase
MATALHRSGDWESVSNTASITRVDLSAEVFRQVYVSLGLTLDTHPVVGITSAIRGEGRTTAAVGMASTLAADLGLRVMLVEIDFERPSLAQIFGLAAAPGFADVLRGGGRLGDVMCQVSERLSVVTAGQVSTDTAQLLHHLPSLDPFRRPQERPDVTMLDLPPIVNYSYGPMAARIADAVVLVVRAGVTPNDIVREAVARLEDRPPRGVVLNGARSSLPSWWPDRGT